LISLKNINFTEDIPGDEQNTNGVVTVAVVFIGVPNENN
jgi:hypothetical protein